MSKTTAAKVNPTAAERADSTKSEAEQAALATAAAEAAEATTPPGEQEHEPMPASLFVLIFGQAEHSVPLAGLLEHQPELRDQDLTPDEWQAQLDAYLASPRP